MVRLLDYLIGLLSLLALPFIAWWGLYQSPQSAAALEAKLETAANAALVKAGIDWARAEMDGQRAILTGAAPSEDAVAEAARIVLRSSGTGGLLMGGVSQVETRVTPAEPVRPYVWTAELTAAGGMILSGHVPSRSVREALVLDARAVARGPVEDRMITAPGATGGDWQGIARFAISQLAELKAGKAELSDNSLTLRGDADDDAVRAKVTAAVSGVAAPFRGAALLRGNPAWSATLTDGALVLSGKVPSEADRRALLAAARQSAGREVVDEMSVAAAGAEGWIAGARAGLQHMPAFASGSMAFDPAINGFTFEGAASPSTVYFLNEDMRRHAGRWRYVLAVDALAAPSGGEDGCEAALNAALAEGKIGFERAGAGIDRSSAPALDVLVSAARACPSGFDWELKAGAGELDEARAERLADFLAGAGLPRPRVAAFSYGPEPAGEGMDGGAAFATGQPFRITVREQHRQ